MDEISLIQEFPKECPVDGLHMNVIQSTNMEMTGNSFDDNIIPKLWWICPVCGFHDYIGEVVTAQ